MHSTHAPKHVGMHRIHGSSMYIGHYGKRKDATRTRAARRASIAKRTRQTRP